MTRTYPSPNPHHGGVHSRHDQTPRARRRAMLLRSEIPVMRQSLIAGSTNGRKLAGACVLSSRPLELHTDVLRQINEKPRWSRTSRARPASLCRTVTKKQRVGYARNCSRPNVSMPALVNALSMTPTSSAVRTARWVKLDRGLGRRDRRRSSEPTKRPAGDRRQTPVRKRPCRMWSELCR